MVPVTNCAMLVTGTVSVEAEPDAEASVIRCAPEVPAEALAWLTAAISGGACALVSVPDFTKAFSWLINALSWLIPAVMFPLLRLAIALLSFAIRALPLPVLRIPEFTRAVICVIMLAICCWAERIIRVPLLKVVKS